MISRSFVAKGLFLDRPRAYASSEDAGRLYGWPNRSPEEGNIKDRDSHDQVESQDVEDLQNDDSLTAADRVDLKANQALAEEDTDDAEGERPAG